MTAIALSNNYFLPEYLEMQSEPGKSISRLFQDIKEEASNTITLGQPFQELDAALGQLLEEYGDTNEVEEISPGTYEAASRFLGLLPLAFPRPEIDVDPDGEIAFEWQGNPERILDLSINEQGRIAYSFLFEDGHQRGIEQLGYEFPKTIEEIIRRL